MRRFYLSIRFFIKSHICNVKTPAKKNPSGFCFILIYCVVLRKY